MTGTFFKFLVLRYFTYVLRSLLISNFLLFLYIFMMYYVYVNLTHAYWFVKLSSPILVIVGLLYLPFLQPCDWFLSSYTYQY
jgi:hypothetical protein